MEVSGFNEWMFGLLKLLHIYRREHRSGQYLVSLKLILLSYEVGGTSLSTPMFSAVWAIANQANGGNPLGQAAPLVYQVSGYAITAVNVPKSATQNNVTGTI